MIATSVNASSRGRFSPRTTWLGAALLGGLLTGCAAPPAGGPGARTTSPAAKELLVKGRVLYTDGRAADGALVTAYRFEKTSLDAPSPAKRFGQVRVGADGAFMFRPGPDDKSILVIADKPGCAIGWGGWRRENAAREIKIELAAPAKIAGRVVDEKGRPVPGATVALCIRQRGSRGAYLMGEEVEDLRLTAGAEGRFAFDRAPAGAGVNFIVEARGHGRLNTFQTDRGRCTAPAADVELRLPAEAIVEADVVDKDTGEPVGDVTLVLYPFGKDWERPGRAVAGQKGRFRWEGVPPTRCRVAGGVPATGPWAIKGEMLDAKAGETSRIRLEAVRGQIVQFVVRDAETHQPVSEAYVNALATKGGWEARGRTGADGVARIRAAPGEYLLHWASAPRYASSPGVRKKFTVKPDEPVSVEVTLERAPRVYGVLRDPAGRAVYGAEVSILGDWDSSESDADGKFEIYREHPERAGGAALLLARDERRGLAGSAVVSDPKQPVDLRLKPGLRLAAQVLDEDDKPLPGAKVTVTIGWSDPDPPSGRIEATPGGDGKCRIVAIPPGLSHGVRARADGYAAAERLYEGTGYGPGGVREDRFRLRRALRDWPAPVVEEIPIPEIPGAWAIWGSVGRDDRGHVWFGVTAHDIEVPSAHLFEYDPDAGKVTDRGDVVGALKQAGVLRPGEQQMKIHTKIFQVGPYLYFASMDEKGEDEHKGVLPTYGGHLWRLNLTDHAWEHLLRTPEALIALAAGGDKVYALGYWNHVLYQYDTRTGKTRSVTVGAVVGHVSRNIIADARGHAYVPRVTQGPDGQLAAALVEYDESLKEIARTPLPFYFNRSPQESHGITGLAPLPDGAIAMVTHNGYLSIIRPGQGAPARVEHVGWFHPDGPRYAASIFLDAGGRYLMGEVHGGWDEPYEWVTCDLKSGARHLAAFRVTRPEGLSLARASLYGSAATDGAGNCYVVGVTSGQGDNHRSRPILLKVNPGKRP